MNSGPIVLREQPLIGFLAQMATGSPLVALLLDFESVDAFKVSVAGLVLIVAECIGATNLDPDWTDTQFHA